MTDLIFKERYYEIIADSQQFVRGTERVIERERERGGGNGGKRFLIGKEADRAIEEGVVRTKGRSCTTFPRAV
jgi:hypothetical protein